MMFIYAYGAFHNTVTDQLLPLKAQVKESSGQHIRRIDRFTQLAIIGASRCVAEQTANPHCNLYLSSADTAKTNTVKALQQVFIQQQAIMPLQFVNMVSNAASFYIAQLLQLQGAGLFINSQYAALEKSLCLAALDLSDKSCQQALVGIVDECAEPIALQRKLLGIGEHDAVGESSFWLLTGLNVDNAIAAIEANRVFTDWLDAKAYIDEVADTTTLIAAAASLADEQHHYLKNLDAVYWPYSQTLATQNGQIGYALQPFLAKQKQQTRLLHIERSAQGHFHLLLIQLIDSQQSA